METHCSPGQTVVFLGGWSFDLLTDVTEYVFNV